MRLDIEKIIKEYNNKKILDNTYFSLEQGEKVCVKGKSGTGKTTLLNICAGMLKPDSGRICVDGKDINYISDLRKKLIAFVPCSDVLLDSLTVRENISLVSKRECSQILDDLGIGYTAEMYPYKLSTGEYKRALLARAIAQDTPFLILDEPTSNLDDESAEKIIGKLNSLKDKGILIASHDNRLMEGRVICI